MKAPALILMTIAAAGWMSSATADDKAVSVSINGAAQELATKNWRQAQQRLVEADKDLGDSPNEQLRAQYLFYSALAAQQGSEDTSLDATQRKTARTKAIGDYESYLKLNPKSGGALNNLAQLYAQDPEQRPKALQLYDRALALNDPRSGAYRLNKAALLGEMGQPSQAIQTSREVLKAYPRNPAARSLTLGLLEKSGNTAQTADYVRQLNASGQVEASIGAAVSQIERRKAGREPILVALAESLANPALTELPDQLVKSTTVSRLVQGGAGPDIGGGVKELVALLNTPDRPKEFVWWRQGSYEHEEYPPKSRAAAMLGLSRALGDRCRRAGKDHYDCAERYYRFAIDFTGATADPEAFLSLADILVASGRKDELAEVAHRYEHALFNGKATAYNRENKPKIFRFHLALGMTYAYLGKWSDEKWAPAGAEFQLQHALDVAEQYNHTGGGERLQMPPAAVVQLSDHYAQLGKIDLSAKVRVEAAEASLAEGDKGSAAELLSTEWRKTLPMTLDAAVLSRVDAARVKAGNNQ